MFQMDFVIEGDVSQGRAGPSAAPVDHRVVRDPEIVWLADAQSGAPEGDVRSIPEMLDEVEAALSRFDLGHAEEVCWQAWSMSRDAGALDLARGTEMLALALDSNAQLFDGAGEDLRQQLELVRAYAQNSAPAHDMPVHQAA